MTPSERLRALLLVMLVAGAIGVTVASAAVLNTQQSRRSPAGSPLVAGASRAAPMEPEVRVHRDAAYDPTRSFAPTSGKPQSKLWFADGRWWAVMLDSHTTAFHIFALDSGTQVWRDTGTVVDSRLFARSDVLWDGARLYIVTAGTADYRSHAVRLRRYTFDRGQQRYVLDPDFPVTLTDKGVKTVTLAKTVDGTLWIAYIANNRVFVQRSDGDDHRWRAGFLLPKATEVAADEVVAIAYGDRLGLMWSNQNVDAVFFSSHVVGAPDDVWQQTSTAVQGLKYADDHISVRTLEGPRGITVYAAIKTSLDELPNLNVLNPQILILTIDPQGNWHRYVFSRVSDRHTRPMLLVDAEHRELYVFATSPSSGGAIYFKRTSADNISFAPGLGTPFVTSATDRHINNPTSTKQNLSTRTGLVVLAADDRSGRYLHGSMALGGGAPGGSAPAIAVSVIAQWARAVSFLVRDTFDSAVVGNQPPPDWVQVNVGSGRASVVAAGGRTFVELSTSGTGPAEACRDFDRQNAGEVTVSLDVSVHGRSAGSAHVLDVAGDGRRVLSVRFSAFGTYEYGDDTGLHNLAAQWNADSWYHLEAKIHLDIRTYDLELKDATTGAVVLRIQGRGWEDPKARAIDRVCVQAPFGFPGLRLSLDNMNVTR